MRIALGIEYDGAPFHGWQSQPSRNTVQDALEAALAKIAAEPVRAICAGRTDTGVHALAQVVHFDTSATRPDHAWVGGVNAGLPGSIAVRWARGVPDAFHARFSALTRRYEYVLANRAIRPALGAAFVGWHHAPLDLERMRDGAAHLIGTHDFSAFRSAECQAKTPVRELRRLEICRDGDIIRFSLEANAFLHHMVRNIVGSLVYVGKGKFAPERIQEILRARDRALAAPTFAPNGLYLSAVDYGPHWGLPQDDGAPVRIPGRP